MPSLILYGLVGLVLAGIWGGSMADPLTWAGIIVWPLVLVWKLTIFIGFYVLLPAAIIGAAGYAALLIHRRTKQILAQTGARTVEAKDKAKP